MDIRRGVFVPNLVTMGNGICGFAALIKIFKIEIVQNPMGGYAFSNPELFSTAAWLILLGMIFDVFDGQIARLSGKTSDLGAQLDSLCDLVTFGLAPAALVIRLNMVYEGIWGKVVWFFCLAYFLGALLRLARFNAENEHDASAHLCFKGLPTPAAAGCVASLLIFHNYIVQFSKRELEWLGRFVGQEAVQDLFRWIPLALPVLMLILGYTMVSSRLKYAHIASRILNRRQSFEFFVSLVFLTVLAAVVPEVVLPLMFIGYLAYTPVVALMKKLLGKKKEPPPRGSIAADDQQIENFMTEPPLNGRYP